MVVVVTLGQVVCDVTLECASTPGKLKSSPDHGENRTCDLWHASPMFYQLSYEVKSVRVGEISELSLVPSTSMYSKAGFPLSNFVARSGFFRLRACVFINVISR